MERSWKGRREYIFQGGVEGTTRCASVLIAQECVDIEARLFIHEQLESIESNATDIISTVDGVGKDLLQIREQRSIILQFATVQQEGNQSPALWRSRRIQRSYSNSMLRIGIVSDLLDNEAQSFLM